MNEEKELNKNVNALDKKYIGKLKKRRYLIDTEDKYQKELTNIRAYLTALLAVLNDNEINNFIERKKKQYFLTGIKINKKFKKNSRWFDDKEKPIDSQVFRLRLFTYILTYFINNMEDIVEIIYYTNDNNEFIEYESKMEYITAIVEKFEKLLEFIIEHRNITDEFLYFGEIISFMDINMLDYSTQGEKLLELEDKAFDISEELKLFKKYPQCDTMDKILRSAFLYSTNSFNISKCVPFIPDYKFRNRKLTEELIIKLGKSIRKEINKKGLNKLFVMYILSDPKIHTKWKYVNEVKDLRFGILSLQFYKFIYNNPKINKIIKKIA